MRAKRDARVDLLAGIELFRDCSRRDLVRAASLSSEYAAPEGKVVCREGESGQEAFVIAEGNAVVTIGGQVVAALGPGAFFGEMAFLDGEPRVATVTATSPMRLLVLTRREFFALLGDVPHVSANMLAVVGGRLREIERATYGPGASVDA